MRELINYQTIKDYPPDKIAMCALDYWQDTDYQAFYGLEGNDFVALNELIQNCKMIFIVGGDNVKVAIIWDEKASGASGGGFLTGAWRQRDLNNIINPDAIISLSANAIHFVLPGKYLCRASAPAAASGRHQARLTLNGAQLKLGTMEFSSGPSSIAQTSSIVSFYGAFNADDIITLEHKCAINATTSEYGFGIGYSTLETNNIYSVVEIIRLGD